MRQMGWCSNCNVPILDGGKCGICRRRSRKLRFTRAEMKPIFKEECEMYENILSTRGTCSKKLFPENMSFYNIMGEVVIDGRKVFRLSYDKETQDWKVKFFKECRDVPLSFKGSDIRRVIKANQHTLNRKEKEAIRFLRKTIRKYAHLPLAVSFSGGKDSAVSLALTELVKHHFDSIFLNTTIEFDQTVQYVRDLSRLWKLNLIEVRPPHDFFSLCEELGPPSTKMKWCCKTQKFSPQNQLINAHYPEGVLVISGIRKSESNIRSRFNKVQINKMIPKQILVFPILDWSSLDVWLYTLWRKIPYNKMYDYGFARIGCWGCPEKSLRDLKLVETVRPDLIERLHKMLRDFALRYQIENPETWIETGKWRFRKTKWTKTVACTSSQLCAQDNQIVYTFGDSCDMNQVSEFMKVFGEISKIGTTTKIANSRVEIAMIGRKMRVRLLDPNIFPIIEKQLSRALNCVCCGACVGVCSVDALRVESGRIRVGGECTNCLKCVTSNGIRMSCVSVNYRPQILSVSGDHTLVLAH